MFQSHKIGNAHDTEHAIKTQFIVNWWNSSSQEVVEAGSVTGFKKGFRQIPGGQVNYGLLNNQGCIF